MHLLFPVVGYEKINHNLNSKAVYDQLQSHKDVICVPPKQSKFKYGPNLFNFFLAFLVFVLIKQVWHSMFDWAERMMICLFVRASDYIVISLLSNKFRYQITFTIK